MIWTAPYFTCAQLLAASREAVASGRMCTIPPEDLEALPSAGRFPVGFFVNRKAGEVQCRVVLDGEGGTGSVDVPMRTFSELRGMTVTVEDAYATMKGSYGAFWRLFNQAQGKEEL